MQGNHSSSTRSLTLFSLVMITAGSVDNVRNLPTTALFGSQLIFFFLLGAILFLLPSALISAELSSTWPEQGGTYVWVKKAFGEKIGLLAVWLQWIENVIWYPTILSFVAGTIAYLIDPALAQNKYFLVSIILLAFWGTTFVNLKGMQSSARFSNLCGIFGLLAPMSLIIILGATWLIMGYPSNITFTTGALIPNFSNPTLWVSLTGIMLSFCGIEIATVHAKDVENPQNTFPKALFWATLIILITLIFGSLAIAIVLPKSQISLVSGLMQAYHQFFAVFHMEWFIPIIGFMLVVGGLGGVSNWIIAPTKGLLVAAKDGFLPLHLQKENVHGAPQALLIYQAIIVSLLTSAFLFMPSINGSYWLLTALAAILYMLMYILMFAAAITLRIKYPTKAGQFKVPGGKQGLISVATLGIFGSLLTILVSLIPPSHAIKIGNPFHYEFYLIGGVLLMVIPPWITYRLKKDAWIPIEEVKSAS